MLRGRRKIQDKMEPDNRSAKLHFLNAKTSNPTFTMRRALSGGGDASIRWSFFIFI